MFRKFALCLALAGFASAGLAVTANAQSTTRIETRPFYGAVVTLEQGVRVYRHQALGGGRRLSCAAAGASRHHQPGWDANKPWIQRGACLRAEPEL